MQCAHTYDPVSIEIYSGIARFPCDSTVFASSSEISVLIISIDQVHGQQDGRIE